MIKKIVLFIVVLFGFINSFGGTIDPNTSDSQHIEYGSKFIHTAKILGKTPDDKPYQGSGVAYQSNVVLTAAHIVNNVKSCYVNINNTTFQVKTSIAHPKYQQNIFGYYDIAICIIDGDIGFSWYPDLYTQTDEVKKICSIAGYGGFGTFLTGATVYDQKLRAGSNMIDSVDRGLLICSPSKSNKTQLEFCIASGDSGGGLFINNKLAGINSCIIHDKGQVRSTYCTQSGHTRISDHVKWIEEQLSMLQPPKE